MPEIHFYTTLEEFESAVIQSIANGCRWIWAGGEITDKIVEVSSIEDFVNLTEKNVPDSNHFFIIPAQFAELPLAIRKNRFDGRFYFFPNDQPLHIEMVAPVNDPTKWLGLRRGFMASPPPSVRKRLSAEEIGILDATMRELKTQLALQSKGITEPGGGKVLISKMLGLRPK